MHCCRFVIDRAHLLHRTRSPIFTAAEDELQPYVGQYLFPTGMAWSPSGERGAPLMVDVSIQHAQPLQHPQLLLVFIGSNATVLEATAATGFTGHLTQPVSVWPFSADEAGLTYPAMALAFIATQDGVDVPLEVFFLKSARFCLARRRLLRAILAAYHLCVGACVRL